MSQLSDDLASIVTDLDNGLRHYKRGDIAEALWWWQFSYVNNWGNLAGAALNALLTVVAHDRFDTDFEADAEAVAVANEILGEADPQRRSLVDRAARRRGVRAPGPAAVRAQTRAPLEPPTIAGGPTVGIVVQKYGGSSLADADAIKRVARRIVETKKAGHDVVVAVSAMGDTTDELLDLAEQREPAAAGARDGHAAHRG